MINSKQRNLIIDGIKVVMSEYFNQSQYLVDFIDGFYYDVIIDEWAAKKNMVVIEDIKIRLSHLEKCVCPNEVPEQHDLINVKVKRLYTTRWGDLTTEEFDLRTGEKNL